MLLINDEHNNDYLSIFMKTRDGKVNNYSFLIVENGKLRIITRTAEICYHKIVDGIETYHLA